MRRVLELARWLLFANSALKWVAAGGAVAFMSGAYHYWVAYPHIAGALAVGALLMATSAVWGFVNVPALGQSWPPRWRWYRSPLRKVSWRFGCVIGVTGLPARGFVVYEFNCSLRVNRGRIIPKRFFLEAKTGKIVPLTIQCGPQLLAAKDIEYIPAGSWHHCVGRILRDQLAPDDGRTNAPQPAEFFSIYDDLTLVFEYDDRVFRKRFSTVEMKRMIDATIDTLAPREPARAVPKVK